MDKEDILKDVKKALVELDAVDLNSTNRCTLGTSQKRVHRAYDILFKLRKYIEGDINDN